MSSTLDYFPTLDGQSYDPQTNGGNVSRLQLFNSAAAKVADVGPAVRVSLGRYRFTIPDVPPGLYTYDVTWAMDATTGPWDDTGNSVQLPAAAPPSATGGPPEWCSLADVKARPQYPTGTRAPSDAAAIAQIGVASDLLYILSGRQFTGVRADVVRPISGCQPRDWFRPWWGAGWGGPWSLAMLQPYTDSWLPAALASWGSCGCGGNGSSCAMPSRILLGGQPIVTVDQVNLDGSLLVEGTDFAIFDDKWLGWLGSGIAGRHGWPTCQDLTKPAGSVGTLEVTYSWGNPIPPGGWNAAVRLSLELIKLATEGNCDLPSRVQTVTREGSTIAVLDSMDLISAGRTGLAEVDLWLSAVNPGGNRMPAFIHSPDMPATVTRGRNF